MNNKRIEYFDLGRFLAICGVILVHTGQHSATGFILTKSIADLGRFGVQLFFVISGATIFLSYANNSQTLIFYIKRFFRIVPLFLIMGFYYSIQKDEQFLITINPFNAFIPSRINIIEGGWSIWNEMYFYLIVPVYFRIRKSKKAIVIFSLCVFVLTTLYNFRFFSLTGNVLQLTDFDYLNLFTQLACFVCGIEYMSGTLIKAIYFCIPQFILGIIFKLVYFPTLIFSADFGSNHWVVLIAILSIGLINTLQYCYDRLKFSQYQLIILLQKLGQLTYTSYMIHFMIIQLFFRSFHLDFGIELNFLIISITTFTVSYLIQPITERLPTKFGKIIASYVQKRNPDMTY